MRAMRALFLLALLLPLAARAQAPDAPVAVQLVPQPAQPFVVELQRLRLAQEQQTVQGPVTGMVLGGLAIGGGATLAAASSNAQGAGVVVAVLGGLLFIPSVWGLLTVVANRSELSSQMAAVHLKAAQAGVVLPAD